MKVNIINRISFGESEGGYYEKYEPYPPRNGYEAKRKQINDTFNLKRARLFNSNLWNTDGYETLADRIEILRQRALNDLDRACNKCLAKTRIRNFFRYFNII